MNCSQKRKGGTSEEAAGLELGLRLNSAGIPSALGQGIGQNSLYKNWKSRLLVAHQAGISLCAWPLAYMDVFVIQRFPQAGSLS